MLLRATRQAIAGSIVRTVIKKENSGFNRIPEIGYRNFLISLRLVQSIHDII